MVLYIISEVSPSRKKALPSRPLKIVRLDFPIIFPQFHFRVVLSYLHVPPSKNKQKNKKKREKKELYSGNCTALQKSLSDQKIFDFLPIIFVTFQKSNRNLSMFKKSERWASWGSLTRKSEKFWKLDHVLQKVVWRSHDTNYWGAPYLSQSCYKQRRYLKCLYTKR